MRNRTAAMGLIVLCMAAAGHARAQTASFNGASSALMPLPAMARLSDARTIVCGSVRFVWQTEPDGLLRRAAQRFSERFARLRSENPHGRSCVVRIHAGHDPDWLTLQAREEYSLSLTPEALRIDAFGAAGVLHAFAALLQLARPTADDAISLPDGRIEDRPRFRWRGLMIDVARHFMSVQALRRQIDAMELTRLNVLHLHLSDGAAFRVESHVFPKLQSISAHGQYYTQRDIGDLVNYAADRGIRVVPEFDVPGHAQAILEAYPEIGAQPLPAAGTGCSGSSACVAGGNVNNAALDPTNPATLIFVQKLFAEMATLFPDRYFHAGGDEVVASQWLKNPHIAASMRRQDPSGAALLQGEFTAKIAAFLNSENKTMIGWDEVLSAPVSRDVVAEVWRASKWTARAAQAGHPVLVSAGYYLDLLRPAREHYRIDPYDVTAVGLFGAELQHAYQSHFAHADGFALDPSAEPLTSEQEEKILGGEAALWTEAVSEPMLDQRVWPRAAALAERFWSPATVRDIADMERRLPLVEARLERLVPLATAQDRQGMLDHLMTGDPGAVETLLEVSVPFRNYAINRALKKNGNGMLAWPVAITPPDSFSAHEFNGLVERYTHGDPTAKSALERMLRHWSRNDAEFRKLVAGNSILSKSLETSGDLSNMARIGLDILAGRPAQSWSHDLSLLLARQDRLAAASSWQILQAPYPQPEDGLLLAVVPGFHMLASYVEAAGRH